LSPTVFFDFLLNDNLFAHIRNYKTLLPALVTSLTLLENVVDMSTVYVRDILLTGRYLFERPPNQFDTDDAAHIYFLEPLFDIDTTAYEDVHLLLNHIAIQQLSIMIFMYYSVIINNYLQLKNRNESLLCMVMNN